MSLCDAWLVNRLQKHSADARCCIVDLVTWKVDQVAAQLSGLLDIEAAGLWDMFGSITNTSEDLELCYCEVVYNVVSVSADFYRRFVRLVRSYPLLFFWLIKALPDVCCSDR